MARISRRYPTVSALLKDGTMLAAAIAEEGDDLPNLQTSAERLDQKLERIREVLIQVDALQAQKQGLVQEMHGLQDQAAKLMSFLHLGVKWSCPGLVDTSTLGERPALNSLSL